jgi:hypothetical protein
VEGDEVINEFSGIIVQRLIGKKDALGCRSTLQIAEVWNTISVDDEVNHPQTL